MREQYAPNELNLKKWEQLRPGASFSLESLGSGGGEITQLESFALNSQPYFAVLRNGVVEILNGLTGSYQIGIRVERCSIHTFQIVPLGDEPHILIRSNDFLLYLWNTVTRQFTHTMRGHTGLIKQVQFVKRKNSTLAVSHSEDQTVRIWNLQTGNCLSSAFTGEIIEEVLVIPDSGSIRLAVRTSSHTVQLWNGSRETKVAEIQHDHQSPILGMESAPLRSDYACCFPSRWGEVGIGSQPLLITYGGAPFLSLWDARNGWHIQNLKGHTQTVLGVTCNREKGLILSWSSDATARLWNMHGDHLALYLGHRAPVLEAKFLSDSPSRLDNSPAVLTRSEDGTLALWEYGGRIKQRVSYLLPPAIEMHPYRIGEQLVILSRPEQGKLCLWKPGSENNSALQLCDVTETSRLALLELNHNTHILKWDLGSNLQVIHGETGETLTTLEGRNTADARFVDLCDGPKIVTYTWTGQIQLWGLR